MKTEVSKVDKNVLLSIPNPCYAGLIKQYEHLKDVSMDDNEKKTELPISVILEASNYLMITTNTRPKLGKPGQPVGELTKFGWISPNLQQHITSSSVVWMSLAYKINPMGVNSQCIKTSGINYNAVMEDGIQLGYCGNLGVMNIYQPMSPPAWDG